MTHGSKKYICLKPVLLLAVYVWLLVYSYSQQISGKLPGLDYQDLSGLTSWNAVRISRLQQLANMCKYTVSIANMG